jgi:hypothetical protein
MHQEKIELPLIKLRKSEISLLGGILAFLILNFALTFVAWNDVKTDIRAALQEPRSVQITSNGVVHQFPLDNRFNRIVKDDK